MSVFRSSILVAALFLGACGGRKLDAVSATRTTDSLLSCGHLQAEHGVNQSRMAGLVGERDTEISNNFGFLLVSPLFLDFSGTEQKEIKALVARNETLLEIMETKQCEDIPRAPETESEQAN